ncbi:MULTISPECIES: hypothetical protein [Enterobacteriaceae]|nr:hypothetical protein [Enterobacter hormaechei]MDL0040959.1 hypothetical protein [Enterobacter hormaechei]
MTCRINLKGLVSRRNMMRGPNVPGNGVRAGRRQAVDDYFVDYAL